ncbi:hypothetical protein [Nonomuraea typhae]|uniref:hypothetical protein n=1 Tax=Nonomuraea typhae TaxID=2603600 RepID=UPI0015E1FF4E|nr:hypothetical protein [Nonomuraea typhae]
MLDLILRAYTTLMDISTSPVVLVALGLAGAYLGAKIVEVVPFTRRIIDRREARAAERE